MPGKARYLFIASMDVDADKEALLEQGHGTQQRTPSPRAVRRRGHNRGRP